MAAAWLLAASLLAPLDLDRAWQVLAFRGLPPNRISAGPDGLTISVQRSAGPVVWPLPQPLRVGRLVVRGRVEGAVRTTAAVQGTPGHDDFALRVGLVEAGTRRPTAWQRLAAPAWVRRLFAFAPPGEGIARVRFFNVGIGAEQRGWQRHHPASDLLHEEVVAWPDAEGRFAFALDLDGLTTLGVWLSADGDDTGSTFSVHVETLALDPVTP